MAALSLSPSLPSGYIGEFEIIDDHRAGKIVVNLTGRLNKVRVNFPIEAVTCLCIRIVFIYSHPLLCVCVSAV